MREVLLSTNGAQRSVSRLHVQKYILVDYATIIENLVVLSTIFIRYAGFFIWMVEKGRHL